MAIIDKISSAIQKAVHDSFGIELSSGDIVISPTKKEFEGDYTYVVFPLVREARKAPEQIASVLGDQLVESSAFVRSYNVVKGFLNLDMDDAFWNAALDEIASEGFASSTPNGQTFMIEFSSPNTNKPLHLGHIRNILLGWSVAQIAKNRGFKVIKTQIVNDRGIAICKSMMAWKLFGDNKTPEDTGIKGDHFVGNFYVQFEKAFREEYREWQSSEGQSVYKAEGREGESEEAFFKRYKNQYFNEFSTLGRQTKAMLIEWEKGDEDTVALWRRMNNWVYEGFDRTYERLGVEFDSINYESNTYLLGKESVKQGLDKGIFYKEEDGSVWIDLEDVGLDRKIVLRSDGTSVYITQDIGTAQKRYREHAMDRMVYVVADEQDYHFKVLFEIMKRLGEPYADNLYHLSYGMVDLPSGKMKSREGTVVDADDLIEEVISEARKGSEERGAADHLSETERNDIYRKIGLAALKYFIIKVNPQKRMVFDPKESVDMQGTTGPYIQNAYVRISSILRKANKQGFIAGSTDFSSITLNASEKWLTRLMLAFPETLDEALKQYDPSVVANYSYALAKLFHRYYHDNVIFDANDKEMTSFRLSLAERVANILEKAMAMLGIEMPDYM